VRLRQELEGLPLDRPHRLQQPWNTWVRLRVFGSAMKHLCQP
jgi:hypothetical protein